MDTPPQYYLVIFVLISVKIFYLHANLLRYTITTETTNQVVLYNIEWHVCFCFSFLFPNVQLQKST